MFTSNMEHHSLNAVHGEHIAQLLGLSAFLAKYNDASYSVLCVCVSVEHGYKGENAEYFNFFVHVCGCQLF